jgi:hypothetical protein
MARGVRLRLAPWLPVLLGLLVWAPVRAAAAPDTGDPAYLAELVAAARARGLADTRYWHLLLHARPRLLGGFESEVDGADFFNAPDGKTDPAAELEATLAAFFAPTPEDPNEQHPQCRFIARYAWLDRELHFDPARLPPRPCERFHAWARALKPEAVVLVFPSAYLNSPPSMFGHTLFRLDSPNRPELVDYALNYAAQVPEDAGALYALKGLLGFYPGHFMLLPYYAKVQSYGELENRDLWEYRLNLTPEQTERMLRHAWELGPTYFDYFFLKENCSYHLLSLLEAADPELHLTDRFHGWTVPTDTLRALASYPGLVADVTFRPSRATVIKHREAEMTRAETRLARRVAAGREAPDGPDVKALDPPAQARVLDLGYDYLLYAESARDDPDPDPVSAGRKDAVLKARSRISADPGETPVPTPDTPPHLGHGTRRLTAGAGARNGDPFLQVDYRAAYHDLLDPDPGYDPLGQLQVFDLAGRVFTDSGRVELSRFTALDIFSLAPWRGVFREPSWKVRAGWDSRRTGDCTGCGAFNFNFGPGLAVPGPGARDVLYAFVDLDANYGRGFERRHAVGPGVTVGALWGPARGVKVHLSGGYTRYALGDAMGERRAALGARVALGRQAALRLTLTARDAPVGEATEAMVALHVYR